MWILQLLDHHFFRCLPQINRVSMRDTTNRLQLQYFHLSDMARPEVILFESIPKTFKFWLFCKELVERWSCRVCARVARSPWRRRMSRTGKIWRQVGEKRSRRVRTRIEGWIEWERRSWERATRRMVPIARNPLIEWSLWVSARPSRSHGWFICTKRMCVVMNCSGCRVKVGHIWWIFVIDAIFIGRLSQYYQSFIIMSYKNTHQGLCPSSEARDGERHMAEAVRINPTSWRFPYVLWNSTAILLDQVLDN
jgi:hypothetical protein